ncbi:putative membrane protein YGL010W [Panacagrimonas perspica]|uniref:Putative membrane protein YGL010W n=1 Tax=Panacagrimonas perspica TaxID=381431 RepID=A0A4S3K6C6_9GAMM|nr:Mpo1-like protein [Panacagrimonas perspica]TDU31460.1 putative membrane protein YGL010W [Panacagrimonas perspica]THD03294.1 hypothetical protein B1810_12095 [Panacagrimonas perspica]
MRTLDQYLDAYAVSHRNPLNQVIHVICVPAIFFATLALLWLVPVGRFVPGLPAEVAAWINLATLLMPLAGVFYLSLSFGSFLVGVIWTVLSVLLILAIRHAHLPLFAIAATVWVVAWIAQFYGHHVEGAKPSFADDILFLLIGPLFVQQKLQRWVTTGSMQTKTR